MQFFVLQQTGEGQKVTLAAFYLEGEANQWWQWLKKGYQEDNIPITWVIFEKELLTGTTEGHIERLLKRV
jgi:hypothetical protein